MSAAADREVYLADLKRRLRARREGSQDEEPTPQGTVTAPTFAIAPPKVEPVPAVPEPVAEPAPTAGANIDYCPPSPSEPDDRDHDLHVELAGIAAALASVAERLAEVGRRLAEEREP
jgi:hypothetical protein